MGLSFVLINRGTDLMQFGRMVRKTGIPHLITEYLT